MKTVLKISKFFVLTAAIALSAGAAHSAKYTLDPAHTSVEFRVRHLVVTKVSGKFDRFVGEFEYDEKNPQAWSAMATIEAASVNTGHTERDNHLRSADFLDVAKFPTLTFRSTGVTGVADGKAKLNGVLTLHGVEKPITLDLEIGGVVDDPWGNTKAGFTASGTINRKDFGIVWNKTLGNGGLVVGEEVEITLHVEGTQIKAAAPAADSKKDKKKK